MELPDFIKKLFKKPSEGDSVSASHSESLALLHWEIILVSFFASTVLVFVTNFFIYRDISRGEFFPVAKKAESGGGVLTDKLLRETVGYFELRGATFDQLRRNHPVFVDPSR